jgi:hypothetical protein
MRIGNPPEELFGTGVVRGNDDMPRRIVEHNLQGAQRDVVERQGAQGMGILAAIARGLMTAILED